MRQSKFSSHAAVCLAVVIILASCGRDALAPTAPGGRSAPVPVISDGSNAGNTHFYFLPPMVRKPVYTGTADPNAVPVVSVCEWGATTEGGRCTRNVATYTRTDGTGSEVIRYDATTESYVVNWHTDTCAWGPCALSPTAMYRIRVLVGVSELGYAEVVLGANAQQLKNVATDEFVALVNGRTLPIKFRIEQGAVALVAAGQSAPVGSAGGLVGSADGSVGLVFPSGALSSSTGITIQKVETPPDGTVPGGAVAELGPDGTTFERQVTLTLAYDPVGLPEGILPDDLAIHALVDGAWAVVPGSVVDTTTHSVSAPVSHFSTYAVTLLARDASFAPQLTTFAVGEKTAVTAYVTACRWVAGTCSRIPLSNHFVEWRLSDWAVATVPLSTTRTNASGYTTLEFTGRNPGSTDVQVGVYRMNMVYDWSPPLRLTVVPPLQLLVDHGLGTGFFPDSTRTVGVQQSFRLSVQLPTATTGTTLVYTHRSSSVLPGMQLSVARYLPNGSTSDLLGALLAGAAGTDTIIATAPGYGRDTLIVRAGAGRMRLVGWPATLGVGDSASVYIEPLDPTGSYVDPGTALAYTLTAGGRLRFSMGGSPITSVRGSGYRSPTFYVIGVAPGTDTLVVQEPNSIPDTRVVTVTGQPLRLEPDSGTVVAGWLFGQNITVTTAMGADVVVSATSVNHLTLYETGSSNYTYPGQTRQYTLPAGSTVKTLGAVDLDGPGHTDTLIVAAPGMLPDTAIYTVVPGRLRVDGWPTALAYGDSAALTVTVVDDAGRPGALGYPTGIDIALGGSGLSFSDGQQSITSVHVRQRTSNTFYVKGAAGGTGTMTMSHRDYVPYSNTVSVQSPPSIAASPTSVTITVAQGSAAQATINVTNGGGGTLSGLAVGSFSDYFTGTPYPWITASLSSTTAPATITITATPPANQFTQTYQTRFGVTAPGASNSEFVFYRILVNVVPATPGAEVAAADNSSCMREESGAVFCWGETSFGATDAPADLFSTIDGGGFTYCGIRTDQTLRCWGYNSDGRATPPAGTFRQLNVAGESSCALRTDDTAACWGFSNDGRISVPPGTYSHIGVGSYHGCAVRKADATLVCWGSNDQGQSTAPAGTFREVVGGAFHTCAVRTDLTLVCFGASPTPPAGAFLTVSAGGGGGHTCAIRLDRTLACWGQNNFGQASPPAGQFVQVSAGRHHSCGVRTDGTPVCWGAIAPVPTTRWSSAPAMITPRWGAASVTVGTQVYVIGGNAAPQEPYPGGPVSTTVERYDAVARTWTTLASLPSPVEHMMAAEYDGRIYVFGGWSCNLCGRNETWIYNIAGNSWSQGPNTPFPMNGGVAAVIGTQIYITTGNCCGSPPAGFVSFDPQLQTFSVLPSMPRAHPFTAGAGVIGGKLYIAGGEGVGGAVDMFDPSTIRWTTVAPMPVNRQHGAGAVVNGKLHVLGGDNDGPGSNRDVLAYDPVTNAWSVATQAPVSRNLLTSAVINGSVFLMGGNTGTVSPGAPIGRVDVWNP